MAIRVTHGTYRARNRANLLRYGQSLRAAGSIGGATRTRIGRERVRQQALGRQALINRGLGGTTILGAFDRRAQEAAERDQQEADERSARMRVGIYQSRTDVLDERVGIAEEAERKKAELDARRRGGRGVKRPRSMRPGRGNIPIGTPPRRGGGGPRFREAAPVGARAVAPTGRLGASTSAVAGAKARARGDVGLGRTYKKPGDPRTRPDVERQVQHNPEGLPANPLIQEWGTTSGGKKRYKVYDENEKYVGMIEGETYIPTGLRERGEEEFEHQGLPYVPGTLGIARMQGQVTPFSPWREFVSGELGEKGGQAEMREMATEGAEYMRRLGGVEQMRGQELPEEDYFLARQMVRDEGITMREAYARLRRRLEGNILGGGSVGAPFRPQTRF